MQLRDDWSNPYTRSLGPDGRVAQRIIDSIDQTQENIRFSYKRTNIAYTLGQLNPYVDYQWLVDQYSVSAVFKQPKIVSAVLGLKMRLERHAGEFLHLCEKSHQHFLNHPHLAVELVKTIRIMEACGFPHVISEDLKRILILAKLSAA